MDNQNLLDKMRDLEKRVGDLEMQMKGMVVSKESNLVQEVVERRGEVETAKVDHKPNAFIQWLKEDWLMKLGAFLLLLALTWFVTYAFANNWIGPIGRISLGIIFGAGIMTGGHLIMKKYNGPGQVLAVVGGVMVILTLFAARVVYDFFTPAIALMGMALIVVLMAVIAIVHKEKAVAYMALIGGAAAPMLVASPEPSYAWLMSYIFLLDLGVLAVVALRGWRGLIVTALAITTLFSSAFSFMVDPWIWFFMAAFFGLFFVATLAAVFQSKKALWTDLIATGLNGLVFLVWVSEFVPDHLRSLVLAAVVLILLVVSYVLLKMKTDEKPILINSALAVLFLAVATSFELHGLSLNIAFAIEALIVNVLVIYILKMREVANGTLWLNLLPVLMSLEALDRFDGLETFFNMEFFAILITLLCVAGSAAIVLRDHFKAQTKSTNGLIVTYFSVFYALVFIWMIVHNLITHEDVANGVSLVIYTIVGVAMFVMGILKDKKILNIAGGVILGFVVLRLLLVEVWQMPLVGRVVTFFAIGVLLISTAFFQKKNSKK